MAHLLTVHINGGFNVGALQEKRDAVALPLLGHVDLLGIFGVK